MSLNYLNHPERNRLPRGVRNNNPGNIRTGKTKWKGKLTANTDGAFEQFQDYAHGIRAMMMLLKAYMGKGYNTVRKIVNRYAPPSENQTDRYITEVSRRTGFAPDQVLEPTKEVLRKLVWAKSIVENGAAWQITAEQFERAWELMPESKKKEPPKGPELA